jgi:protein involved in polysaccharide export with SLBB domain
VLGAVVVPGAYDYSDSMNPWDAIARAGGASDDAILTGVEIIPGDGSPGRKMEIADVQTAIQAGTLETLPRLRAGDTVRVPRRTGGAGSGNLVYVMGAVTQPGPKSLDVTPDLLSLLVFSIPTADANLGKIQVVRRGGKGAEHLRVDARLSLQGAIEPGNIPLREGDTVYIERSTGGILARLGVLSGLIGLTTGIIALTR